MNGKFMDKLIATPYEKVQEKWIMYRMGRQELELDLWYALNAVQYALLPMLAYRSTSKSSNAVGNLQEWLTLKHKSHHRGIESASILWPPLLFFALLLMLIAFF